MRVTLNDESGAISTEGDGPVGEPVSRSPRQTIADLPRLYTVMRTGIESPNASSSFCASTSIRTPDAASSADLARSSSRSTDASRSRSAGGHGGEVPSGFRNERRGIAPQRGAISRAASNCTTSCASESTTSSGWRRSSERCTQSASAAARRMFPFTASFRSPRCRTVVSTPSKSERSLVADTESFTRVASRMRCEITAPCCSSSPCPCERCCERLSAASSAVERPITASKPPTSKDSVDGTLRTQVPR